MINKEGYFQDHLEWEIIEPEVEITNLSFEQGIYNLSKDCIIKFSRDNQYNLVATLSGIINHPKALDELDKGLPGTFIKGESIIGYSLDGLYKYNLLGVVIERTSMTPISINPMAARFQAALIIDTIEKSFIHSEHKLDSIQEWYLSGSIDVFFPRTTKRSVDKSFKRLREEIDPPEKFTLAKSSSHDSDFLTVNLNDFSFIVSKVPKEYGPDWSYNLSIEYRQTLGKIPTEEERTAISELVGFVLGNQLLKIGQSSYDETSSLVLQEYQQPWGDNVVKKCKRGGLTPVEIGQYRNRGYVELLLNELLPQYLSQRDKLFLKDALWKFWIAKYSSIGANLPILSSALETLAEQVLKSHADIKQYYIEYNEFNGLIEEEISSISKKLNGNIHKDKVINRIKGASQRGSNEKIEMMFEILELPVSSIERKAIKARNKMAHSSLGKINENEIREIVRLTRAYETLFHRVFLKILSHNGDYIDYYTLGHPNRNINVPIPV